MRNRFLILAAVLFSVMTAVSLSAQSYTLRLAHNSKETHPIHKGALEFKQLVEERSGGRVKITIFPNQVLGSPPQYTEQLGLGTIDLCLTTEGQLQAYVREYAAVMIPFIFEDYDHAHRVMDGPAGQQLAAMAEAKGFKILADWEWGFKCITNSKKPIVKPADLAGLKFRVPPEIQLIEFFKAMNAPTSVISFNELYMAMSQGVVDGQTNPLYTIYDQKFYEVQKYLALTFDSYNSMKMTMSKKVWDKMPLDLREILQKAAQELAPKVRKMNYDVEQDIIAQLKAKGMTVTTPDVASFKTAVKPAMDVIADYAGKEFTKKFLEQVDAARAKR